MLPVIYSMSVSLDGFIAGPDRGTPYFPPLAAPLGLRLIESRIFGSGVVSLRYRRALSSPSLPRR